MTVHCPHCSTGYLLPDHLVGPRGARVRCPHCHGAFVVLSNGGGAGSGEAFRESEPDPASAPPEEPAAIAEAVLEALVARLGDALAEARRDGRVLSAHGPSIFEAFAEYRRRAGVDAPPDPFRAALARRCGVDLIPRPPA